MQVMYKQGWKQEGEWSGSCVVGWVRSVSGDSGEDRRTSKSRRSWWTTLRGWLSSAVESPGKLTLRIDDPPDWPPDPRSDSD
ncbi:MAG TPA: hypothetical protein VM470_00705 [Acidimicrobiia bacterium]|nr:hypothetical protein [Acidimicrobiia bacterium]